MKTDKQKPRTNHLAGNLEKFRLELGLSPAELASKSDVDEKTIRNIENGIVTRPYPNTILKIALGLKKSPGDLLDPPPGEEMDDTLTDLPVEIIPPPAPVSRKRQVGLGFLSLISVLAISGYFLRDYAMNRAEIQFSFEKITAKDAILGKTLWEYESSCQFWFFEVHPDNPSILLVGLSHQDLDGGRLLALDRASGSLIWQFSPDWEQLIGAFGPENVTKGRFSCRKILFVDITGTGSRDLIVYFLHDKYFPSCLCWLKPDGSYISQYSSYGHLNDIHPLDLDTDGKEEILAAGYNNSRPYRGGTVFILDEENFRGASVDSIANPHSRIHDGSLVRIVIPQYPGPIMDVMSHRQLCAGDFSFGTMEDGELLINVEVGIHSDERIIVSMDSDLRIMGSTIKDSFRDRILMAWPDSLAGEFGPIDEEWRESWLEGHIRFEDGKRAHTDHH